MLLSIVTVTYQDLEGLRSTIKSLRRLRADMKHDAELIIVDGGTGAEFHEVVSDLHEPVKIISEPDQGIYDAMNKGLRLSQGEFVWFLNGGDECTIQDVQAFVDSLTVAQGKMVFAGYTLDTGHGRIPRRPRTAKYIWHGLPTSHQAIFYPGGLIRPSGYDLRYKIVGDYELTARLLASGVQSCQVGYEVASFKLGGISQKQARLVALEASRVQKVALGCKWHSLVISRLRHMTSRNVRRFQSRKWGRLAKSS